MIKQSTSVLDKRDDIKDFIFVSKYARTHNSKKETWEESVSRVMTMHWQHFESTLALSKDRLDAIRPYFDFAYEHYLKQNVLGAQRALQYGGEQLRKHNGRMYNCTGSYLNRPSFYKEVFYALLCGMGAGYSVQSMHINQLPVVKGCVIKKPDHDNIFVVPDSIEGWSEAADVIVRAHFDGHVLPTLNYSQIRKKGAFISGGFKAPGPEPLKIALDAIHVILSRAIGRKLRPFEAHRITCLLAHAVVSAGVRRGALIAIFDADDTEMRDCKTGNYYLTMPELSRANNSAAILPDTPREQYEKLFDSAKSFGEPGILFLKNSDFVLNPCAEVGMFPQIDIDGTTQYGWSTCNLTEINGGAVTSFKEFKMFAKAAAILGTFQATYTDFRLMGDTTKKIVERDALIGVGITGMAASPKIMFNPEYQKAAAEYIKQINHEVADILKINHAARCTVIKPSGNSSQLLGTSSGIHPFHFRKFIRHIQATTDEQAANEFASQNPFAADVSSQNANDYVLQYPVTVEDDALVQSDITATEFIDMVKLTQDNWIEYGTDFDHQSHKDNPELRHNVSNTIRVKNYEWDIVKDYIWQQRKSLCGVSMLSDTGDLAYEHAPYSSYLDGKELMETYGSAAMLASGLVVDGLDAFDTLHLACATALDIGESLHITENCVADMFRTHLSIEDDNQFVFLKDVNGLFITDANAAITDLYNTMDKKRDWVRRFKKFAKTYLNGDMQNTSNCLKHANRFHRWEKLKAMKTIDWSSVEWETSYTDAGSDTASGCHGGACEI